jgi:ankyrin repeat protein
MKTNKRIWTAVIAVVSVLAIVVVINTFTSPYHWSRKLIDAIENDDISTAEKLLQEDYDVNTPETKPNRFWDAFTETTPRVPLSVACEYGNYNMVKLLIDHGATASHIEGTDSDFMHQALFRYQPDDLRVVPLLLQNGADLNFTDYVDCPILSAVSLSAKPSDGVSPEEAMQGSLTLFKLLESCGADIRVSDPAGTNAILEAAAWQNTAVLQYLLDEKGFDVNFINSSKQTPLMRSVYLENYANEDTIQILLNNGADKSLKDMNGKTAYDYAVENGNEEFAYLLKP